MGKSKKSKANKSTPNPPHTTNPILNNSSTSTSEVPPVDFFPLRSSTNTDTYSQQLERAKTVERTGLTFATSCLKYRNILFSIHLILPLFIIFGIYSVIFFPSSSLSLFIHQHTPSPINKELIHHWTKYQAPYAHTRMEAWEIGSLEGQLSTLLLYYTNLVQQHQSDITSSIHHYNESKVIQHVYTRLGSLYNDDYSHNISTSTFTTNGSNLHKQQELLLLLSIFHTLQETTKQFEHEEGKVSYLSRIFSLVNALWLMGIVGILISIGPLITSILSGLTTLLLYLWYTVFCHLWRPLIYCYGFLWFIHSTNTNISIDIRIYMNLFFILAIWGCYVITLYQLAYVYNIESSNPMLTLVYGCVLFFPLAHSMNSSLLGFLTVFTFFETLGFGMSSTGWGYRIGFGSENSLKRNVTVAVLLFLFHISIRTGIAFHYWSGDIVLPFLAPYLSGIQVLGSTVMYLGLLILSSPWYDRNWYNSLIINFLCLVLGLIIGHLLPGMGATINTVYVFLYLLGLDLLSYTGYSVGKSFWLSIFLLSLGTFYGALQIHSYPELLINLYRE